MHSHAAYREALAMKIAIIVLLALAWVTGLLFVLPAGS
jgi:hypothetical protein